MSREESIKELRDSLASRYEQLSSGKTEEVAKADAELKKCNDQIDEITHKLVKSETTRKIIPAVVGIGFFIICVLDRIFGDVGNVIIWVGGATAIMFFFVAKFIVTITMGSMEKLNEKKISKLNEQISIIKRNRPSDSSLSVSKQMKELEDEFTMKMTMIDEAYFQENGFYPADKINSLKELFSR